MRVAQGGGIFHWTPAGGAHLCVESDPASPARACEYSAHPMVLWITSGEHAGNALHQLDLRHPHAAQPMLHDALHHQPVVSLLQHPVDPTQLFIAASDRLLVMDSRSFRTPLLEWMDPEPNCLLSCVPRFGPASAANRRDIILGCSDPRRSLQVHTYTTYLEACQQSVSFEQMCSDNVAGASTSTHETTLFHRHCATEGLRLCGLATVALPSSSHRQQAALALQMDSLGDIYSWSIQLDSFGKPEVCADSPEAPPAAQQNQTAAPLRAAGFERTAEAIKELESRVQDRVPRDDGDASCEMPSPTAALCEADAAQLAEFMKLPRTKGKTAPPSVCARRARAREYIHTPTAQAMIYYCSPFALSMYTAEVHDFVQNNLGFSVDDAGFSSVMPTGHVIAQVSSKAVPLHADAFRTSVEVCFPGDVGIRRAVQNPNPRAQHGDVGPSLVRELEECWRS